MSRRVAQPKPLLWNGIIAVECWECEGVRLIDFVRFFRVNPEGLPRLVRWLQAAKRWQEDTK